MPKTEVARVIWDRLAPLLGEPKASKPNPGS
jgi:hypothetical protein